MISVATGIRLSRPRASLNYGRIFVVSGLFILVFAVPLKGKEWRGIKPLHSTREDVERLLGSPTGSKSDTSFYQFEKERVSFEYSTGYCGNGWKVPLNTVVSIWVTPAAHQLKLKDLKLNLKLYTKVRDQHVQWILHYKNEREGVRFEVDTNSGEVTLIEYFAARADKRLRCRNENADRAPIRSVMSLTEFATRTFRRSPAFNF